MKQKLPIILLFLISLVVVFTNYRSGIWLTGWDNLHPEFNLPLNIQRSVFSVWQEYQGLGLLGGMGHATDIIRQSFLYLLSFVFKISDLRYIYTFLMLIIGPLGVYKLSNFLLSESNQKENKDWISFTAGLFYLFNLATVKIFFVPFETFTAHFGFLPWLFYSLVLYLRENNIKNLFLLVVINIFSLTQSYVPTIFVVYIISVFILLFGFILKEKNIASVKKSVVSLFIIFLINAFWFLPFMYFTVTSSSVVGNAHENYMATEDVFLRNKEFGTIADVSILKGFWFKFVDLDINGDYQYMSQPWRDHLNSPIILSIGFILFAVVLLGLFQLVRKNNRFSIGFIYLFLFSFAMLAVDTFPFDHIAVFLRDYIPLFSQVFRVPFTKFAILAAFAYSILFSFGLSFLIAWLNKYSQRAFIFVTLTVTIFILTFSFPVFNGYLFYDFVKLKIPQEYLQTIDFFKGQNVNTRIANFPQPSFWGWNHYSWGNRGSGFIWYGIPQPILDRAFDGYSSDDENYYWEISNAIYSQNASLFDTLLHKYQISWLVLDKNIISNSSPKELYFDEWEKLVSANSNISLQSSFGNLTIYKVNLDPAPKDFVFLAKDLPVIGPEYKWNNLDKGYSEYGNYISEKAHSSKSETRNNNPQPATHNSQQDIYYPFRSLFTGRQQNELEFGVEDKADYFSFTYKIPTTLSGYNLILPQVYPKELIELDKDDLSRTTAKTIQIYLDNELVKDEIGPDAAGSSITLPNIKEGNLEIRVPKIRGYNSSEFLPESMNLDTRSCDKFNEGFYNHEFVNSNNSKYLHFISLDSSNCVNFEVLNFPQDIGYLLSIENRNITGKSLNFTLINQDSQHSDIETSLPKKSDFLTSKDLGKTISESEFKVSNFIIPPMGQYGRGYTLHLDNLSIGRVKTVNDLGRITVNPIPYRFLTGLKIVKTVGQLPITNDQSSIQVDHPNPSLYQVSLGFSTLSQSDNTTLVLSQSYDEGWKAYLINKEQITNNNFLIRYFPFFFGQEIKDHVLVNNWENGWMLRNETMKQCSNGQCQIIIVYLPQYLEYVGFILLGVSLLVVIFYPKLFIEYEK